MGSLPSGSRDDVELVKIEAAEFSLVIKGSLIIIDMKVLSSIERWTIMT